MNRALGGLLAATLALAIADPASAQDGGRCQPADLVALAGWEGVWLAEAVEADINGREHAGAPPLPLGMKLVGIQAPWNEAGWARLEDEWGRGVNGVLVQAGWSFPVMMSAPAPFKFVIAPHETVIASQYRDIRYIRTDGSGHAPEDERWSTPWGDSVGCWQGDTLVVETIGVRYAPAYNPFAPPLSESATFAERYRLTGPDQLEADFVITDPQLLERPWEVHMVYRRHPVLTRLVHDGDVFENDRLVVSGQEMSIGEAAVRPSGPSPRPTVALSTAELDRVAGRYAIEGAPIELVVSRKGARLFARAEPLFPVDMPIHPSGPLTFFSRISAETLQFETDGDGRVTGLTGTSPEGVPFSGRRKPD